MALVTIDLALCDREGACIDSCPHGLLLRGQDGLPVERVGAASHCIRCGQCVSVCSKSALTNHLLAGQEFQDKSTFDRAADPLAYIIKTRRSVRAFQKRAVDKTVFKSLFDLVRYAPTANNSQKLWWLVTLEAESTKNFAALALEWLIRSYYPNELEKPWEGDADPVLRGAPHVVLCCAPEEYRWGATDAAIAVTHVELLAASRGLATCWAGIFIRALEGWPPLLEALALPPGQKVFGGLMLGYPRFNHRLVPPRKPAAIGWR
ncbi:MAG: nitroreductase family protein [Humidesulfovibrio sp.]|uniref:nitroreductase family protein n=1 Tax=Humidesulfovibrio sp. TaxID=2910988 RepID=UPI0027F0444B|nr:nitroreductase family protein [Humidesulfovibrio sp.]MDQ7833983.1 nitroreductase family protein [Humidesulfovibrio sp.]